MAKKALIIIRHGHDLPDDAKPKRITNPNPDYPLPDSSVVKVSLTRLTQEGNDYGKPPAGEIQAKNLGSCLSSWMAGTYFPIGRILTQDPKDGADSSTPNPFCTIYPAIDPRVHSEVTKKPVDVVFYDAIEDLQKKKIFDDGDYSTVMCSTRQTIWGHKEKGNDNPKDDHQYPDSGTFMDYIIDKKNNPSAWEKLKYAPSKCKQIYVFTDFDEGTHTFANLDVFNLNGNTIS